MGVTAMLSDVRVRVLVLTHACDAVRAAEPWNVPALEAVHRLMCEMVSEVPPFVHGPTLEDAALEPDAAAAMVACFRVVSPAAAAVAPDAPGSAVWSFTQHVAVANDPSNQPLTTEAAIPTVTMIPLH